MAISLESMSFVRSVMKRFYMLLSVGEGRYEIELRVYPIGSERLFVITSAKEGHIGAVTIREKTGLQSIGRQGHRDDVVSERVAEMLHAGLGEDITVVCGIHIDHATKEEIALLVANAQQCAIQYMEENHE
jgi:hypothetical protein